MSAWLARLLSQCRRALRRGVGPRSKAAELRLEWIAAEAASLRGASAKELFWPFVTYVAANRWLLREIEVANAKLGHLGFDDANRIVSLFLPVSKTDSGGLGRERRLRCCCGGGAPVATCPFHAMKAHVVELKRWSGVGEDKEAAWRQPLFPTMDNQVPTKAATVAGWQRLAPEEVSVGGHSARRSGAKRCAREGWHILAIQHLGRWASAQVLEYVEEAYAESPQGPQGAEPPEKDWEATPAWEERLRAVEAQQAAVLQEVRAGARPTAPGAVLEAPPKEKEEEVAFVHLMTGGARKIHVQASRHPLAPSWTWSTRCGVRFAHQRFRFLDASVLAEVDQETWCRRCCKFRGAAAEPEEDIVAAEGALPRV